MGAFVLGVLVGWLAEWLFFTFILKGDDGQDSDCSQLKTELEAKNRQISSLQDQLASSDAGAKSKSSSKPATSGSARMTAVKTPAAKKTTVANKTRTSANKETASSASTKNRKASSKSSTTSAGKRSATATQAKSTARKSVNKTNTTTSTGSSTGTRNASTKGDDFTKLSGIGPSMSETLKSLGIDTFAKLAATDDDILRDMLEASGARMNNNKEAMDSWNEQATVAAKGDFAALKRMQAALKK